MLEEQRAVAAGEAQIRLEQAAQSLAEQRAVVAEQAEQVAVQQHEEEQKLLAQQQQALENEQRLLTEIAQRIAAEEQAAIATEAREIAERAAREAAKTKAMLEHQAMTLAQQCVELDRREEARLRAQIEQSQAEVAARRMVARLCRNKQIIRLVKATGVAAAFVGISLSVFHALDTAPAQPAEVSQPMHAALPADAGAVTLLDPKPADEPLLLGDLKMSDHLTKKD